MKENKIKKMLSIILTIIIILTIAGLSLAYYLARVQGSGKELTSTSGELSINYLDEKEIQADNLAPGWSEEKTITVTNTGDDEVNYNLYWSCVENELTRTQDLTYTITDEEGSEIKTGTFPTENEDKTIASQTLGIGETKTYTIKIEYARTSEDQSVDMGKIFKGIINVQPEGAEQINECPSEAYTVSIEPSDLVEEATKEVNSGENVTFTITNNSNKTNEKLTCTNGQSGSISGNTITINKVTNNTTCTLTYEVKPIIQAVNSTYEEKLWQYKHDITKIVIENTITEKAGETASWDISDAGDSSVMARIVPNTEDASTYTAYIQADGKVIANTDSSYLFYYFDQAETIEGLENLDTSEVTNMQGMFSSLGRYTTTFNLDVSSLDTKNVTNMQGMFISTGRNATSFNLVGLENFDTSRVTNMYAMFQETAYTSSSFEIDLSNWNTSNVISMESMFYSAGYSATKWSVGDLSNWNTSNVTDMSYMFWNSGYSTTEWYVGDLSNWDTSSVTDMSHMFTYTGRNATTFNSIGNFKIPDGCNALEFASGSLMFTGNIIMEGTFSDYENMFYHTATNPDSRVNLIYNSTNEVLVDELISLYGPSGSSSQGNIYKMSSVSDIYKVSVTVLNGTIDGETVKAVNSGDSVTFTTNPSSGYTSPTVTCTNSQSGSISGSTLNVSNIRSDTTCTVTYLR